MSNHNKNDLGVIRLTNVVVGHVGDKDEMHNIF